MNVGEEFAWLCAEKWKTTPPSHIVEQLQGEGERGAGTLYLTSRYCSVPVCKALAAVLPRTQSLYYLDLSDCILTQDCVHILLNGLYTNTSVRSFNLKGNNLCGSSVGEVGRLLSKNQTITRLSLEWNCIAADLDYFTEFCNGLSESTSLEYLDLRNNQLSHLAVISLASALQSNKKLKYLDLRWNNIGALGANCIQGMLKFNRSLTKIDLQGNHVPKDLLKSIETSLFHNLEPVSPSPELTGLTTSLNSAICAVQEKVLRRTNSLADEIFLGRETMIHGKTTDCWKLVEEKNAAIDKLTASVEMLQKELRQEKKRAEELTNQDKAREQLITALRENWASQEEEAKRKHQEKYNQLSVELKEYREANCRMELEAIQLKVSSEDYLSKIDGLQTQLNQMEIRASADKQNWEERIHHILEDKDLWKLKAMELESKCLDKDRQLAVIEQEEDAMRLKCADMEAEIIFYRRRLEELDQKQATLNQRIEIMQAEHQKQSEEREEIWREEREEMERRHIDALAESQAKWAEQVEASNQKLAQSEAKWTKEAETARSKLAESQARWAEEVDFARSKLDRVEQLRIKEEMERRKLEQQVEISSVEVERMKEILAKQEDRLQEQENKSRDLEKKIKEMTEEERRREDEARKRDQALRRRDEEFKRKEERLVDQVKELSIALHRNRERVKQKDDIIRRIRSEETARAQSLFRAVKSYIGDSKGEQTDKGEDKRDPTTAIVKENGLPNHNNNVPGHHNNNNNQNNNKVNNNGGLGQEDEEEPRPSSSGMESNLSGQSPRETSFLVNGQITNGSVDLDCQNGNLDSENSTESDEVNI